MIYLQEGYTKRLKDIINAYNCFLKSAVFSIKASNGQFIIVLDGIICFSMRVCDNSLLVLKISFSGLFFRKQKGTRVFQWQEDIVVVFISAFSSTKSCLRILKF